MAEPTKSPDSISLLLAYLSIYDGYHSQKEVMAYSAVVLYLGGASALFAQKAFWLRYYGWQLALLLVLVLFFSFIAFSFVRWQLGLAIQAGHIFEACSELVTIWLTEPPQANDLNPEELKSDAVLSRKLPFDGFFWPAALAKGIKEVRKRRSRPLFRPRVACYSAIWIWAVADLARIFLTWRGTWPSE